MKSIISKVVVGAVIVKDDKVLILQRSADETTYPNLWELPSGKKEESESVEQTLVREVKEEAGIEISAVEQIAAFNYQIEKEFEVHNCTQINFLATAEKSDVVLSLEHQHWRWISEEEINDYGISESTKEVIRKCFKILKKE